MSSFCTAKPTHIFSAKKFQHICVSPDVNFNESLTNDIVSFEQLGPVCLASFKKAHFVGSVDKYKCHRMWHLLSGSTQLNAGISLKHVKKNNNKKTNHTSLLLEMAGPKS